MAWTGRVVGVAVLLTMAMVTTTMEMTMAVTAHAQQGEPGGLVPAAEVPSAASTDAATPGAPQADGPNAIDAAADSQPVAPPPAPAERAPAQPAPIIAQAPPVLPAPPASATPVVPGVDGPSPANDSSTDVGDHASSRPGVGLVAAAGLHTGLAAGVRLGVGDIGVELVGGYQVLIAIWKDDSFDGFGPRDSGIDLASSAQLGAEVYFTPWHPVPSSAIGLKSGYRYNTALKHGFSVAITFLVDLSEHLALEGLAGGSFFPGSGDRLREALDLSSGTEIVYASDAQYFEYGFELIWYP